jgi:transposase-like protein
MGLPPGPDGAGGRGHPRPRRGHAGGQEGARRSQLGRRERTQSWRELLVELEARGLAVAPEIAVGDGALGFWKVLDEVFPGTHHQRCSVHKVSNVLDANQIAGRRLCPLPLRNR